MESQAQSTEKSFAIASLVFGILALAGFCTIVLSFLFGGLSILFAILSHRKGKSLSGTSLGGVLSSISGIALASVMLIMSLASLPAMLTNEATLKQLNDTYESLYGQSFEEMLEESYGMSLEDILEMNNLK